MSRRFSSIAVVGAGALGCYFGAMLARAGYGVTLIGRKTHVDAINSHGLRLKSGGVEDRIAVPATTEMSALAGAGLVLFCVKSTDTDDAARAMAPHVEDDAVILSLQNGVDNAERIRRHVGNPVVTVLVYAAAQMIGPGQVEHTGGGNVVVGLSVEAGGIGPSVRAALDDVAALFASAGVPAAISEDIAADLWTKLLMNCAYNAISALTGAPYGQMTAMPEIRSVMRAVVDEVVAVALAKNIRLPGDVFDAVIRLSEVMPRTISSTAQDIAAGRPTEIDHLNGYVVRQGEALGVPTPVNRTLHALTVLLERTRTGRAS
jgi:2-dehydropantoate 2-reductase